MKTLNKFIVSAILVCGLGPSVYAANEVAAPDGQGGATTLGSVRLTTNTTVGTGQTVTEEIRQLRVTDSGQQKMIYSVTRSSFITVNFTSNTNINNLIFSASTTFFSDSTGTVYFSQPNLPGISTTIVANNPHVFCIGTPAKPCSNLELKPGSVFSNVRVWDSRGDTTTTPIIWDGTIGLSSMSPTGINFNLEFTSGIVIMKQGGSVSATWQPGPFNPQNLTR